MAHLPLSLPNDRSVWLAAAVTSLGPDGFMGSNKTIAIDQGPCQWIKLSFPTKENLSFLRFGKYLHPDLKYLFSFTQGERSSLSKVFTSETWPPVLSKFTLWPDVHKYICGVFWKYQWQIFNLPCAYTLFYNWNWKVWQFHKLHYLHIVA